MQKPDCTQIPPGDWSAYPVTGIHSIEETRHKTIEQSDETVVKIQAECQDCGSVFEQVDRSSHENDRYEAGSLQRINAVSAETLLREIVEQYDDVGGISVDYDPLRMSLLTITVHTLAALDNTEDEQLTRVEKLAYSEETRMVVEGEDGWWSKRVWIIESEFGPCFEMVGKLPAYKAGDAENSVSIAEGVARLREKPGKSSDELRELLREKRNEDGIIVG